jgi:hypothetical protein
LKYLTIVGHVAENRAYSPQPKTVKVISEPSFPLDDIVNENSLTDRSFEFSIDPKSFDATSNPSTKIRLQPHFHRQTTTKNTLARPPCPTAKDHQPGLIHAARGASTTSKLQAMSMLLLPR